MSKMLIFLLLLSCDCSDGFDRKMKECFEQEKCQETSDERLSKCNTITDENEKFNCEFWTMHYRIECKDRCLKKVAPKEAAKMD